MADITKYYSLTDALKQYGQINGESNPNATTMQDMQAYMQQNGDTLENVVKAFLWQPETNIVVGQEVHSPNLPAGYMAVCTVAGITGATEPSWSTTYSTFTDGTVTWTITSLYSGKVNKAGDTISGALTTTVLEGLKRNVTDSYLLFLGGTAWNKGAFLQLHGMTSSGKEGCFSLNAHNGTSAKALTGTPDGDLTWFGKTIIRSDNIASMFTTAYKIQSVSNGDNITAPTVAGYSFVCWLQPATDGWLGSPYMVAPYQNPSQVFDVNNPGNQRVGFSALYVKNS